MQHKRIHHVPPGWRAHVPNGGYIIELHAPPIDAGWLHTGGFAYHTIEEAEEAADRLLAAPWCPVYRANPLPGSQFETAMLADAEAV